jgi:DNA-binding NarL/FixJ family response regulator
MCNFDIKIAIADDHKVLRQAFIKALSSEPNLQPLFEADNGIDLLKKLENQQPDVLLLDIHMPILNGIEALKIIHNNFPCVRILIFTGFTDDIYVSQCLEYGINGFLTKTMDLGEIIRAIKTAYLNDVYHTNLLDNSLFKNYLVQKKKTSATLLPDFSDEELRILTLLSEEKNTYEISCILNLSKRSIELKKDKMRQKANVKTVGGLLLHAFKRKLIL